jgi:hypothetical protein
MGHHKAHLSVASFSLALGVVSAGCGTVTSSEIDASSAGGADAEVGRDAQDSSDVDASDPDAPAFRLPDSATRFCTDGAQETSCPTSGEFSGQDGDYRIHPPAYELRASNAVVVDMVTLLAWTRNHNEARGLAEAEQYCQQVADNSIGGRDDWRVPTRLELATLLDLGRHTPAFPDVFASIPAGQMVWTSTPAADDAPRTWMLETTSGSMYAVNFGDAGFNPLVFCVSGQIPGQSFEAFGALAVRDTRTGLVWEQQASEARSWGEALARCEELSLEGQADWRLPKAKELHSLVDDTRAAPAFDPALQQADADALWTSTPLSLFPSRAHVIFRDDGRSEDRSIQDGEAGVRCVRGPDRP